MKLRLPALVATLAIVLLLATMMAPAALAVSDCQAWDGVGGNTDVVNTTTGTYNVGNNPNFLYGIRFKALGTNPVFKGWEFNASSQGMRYSYYLHNWNGSLISNGGTAYIEGVITSGPTLWALGPANYVSLTENNEYIASVLVYVSQTLLKVNVPILYPSATSRMSATSGSTYYYHSGSSGWPNSMTWTNADPSAGDNWPLSPVVCAA